MALVKRFNAPKVTASDVGIGGGPQFQQVTELRNLDVQAKAFQNLATSFGEAEGDVAAAFADNQARDETREVLARKVALSEWVRNEKYGNKQQGIPGIDSLQGQAFLEATQAFPEKLKTEIARVRGEITNSKVGEGFDLEAEGIRIRIGEYLGNKQTQERERAENATAEAALQSVATDGLEIIGTLTQDQVNKGGILQEGSQSRASINELSRLHILTAKQAGITDEEVIKTRVRSGISAFLETAIKNAAKQTGGSALANALYYDRFTQDTILPEKKGELEEILRTASTNDEAEQLYSEILSNPDLNTDEKRLQAVANAPKHVRTDLRRLIKGHNDQLRTQEKAYVDAVVEKAHLAAADGKDLERALTTEELITLKKSGNYEAISEKLISKQQGYAYESDKATEDKLWIHFRNNTLKDIDFSDPEWAKLTKTDRGIWQGRAAQGVTTPKQKADASRLTGMINATKAIVKDLKLSDEQVANIHRAIAITLDRKVNDPDNPQTSFSDKEYMQMFDAAFFNGEHLGEGVFDDPDITVGEAIAKNIPFTGADFVKENQPFVLGIAKEVGITEKEAMMITGYLAESGLLPDAGTVKTEVARRRTTEAEVALLDSIAKELNMRPLEVTLISGYLRKVKKQVPTAPLVLAEFNRRLNLQQTRKGEPATAPIAPVSGPPAPDVAAPDVAAPDVAAPDVAAPGLGELGTEIVGKTLEGRNIFKNPDGSESSERSTTIQKPNGKWINPPTIYDGKEVSPEEALKIVTDTEGVDPETGRVLPEFDSMEDAVAAAEARSASLGLQDDPLALSREEEMEALELARKDIESPSRKGPMNVEANIQRHREDIRDKKRGTRTEQTARDKETALARIRRTLADTKGMSKNAIEAWQRTMASVEKRSTKTSPGMAPNLAGFSPKATKTDFERHLKDIEREQRPSKLPAHISRQKGRKPKIKGRSSKEINLGIIAASRAALEAPEDKPASPEASPKAIRVSEDQTEDQTLDTAIISDLNLRGDSTKGAAMKISNNPGNIRATDIPWDGKTGSKNGFEVFDTPESGIRAIGKLLQTYESKGFNTIEKIISRYAPPEDNNPTENYIAFVAEQSGFKRDEVISMSDQATLLKLVKAIIRFEGTKDLDKTSLKDGVGRLFA